MKLVNVEDITDGMILGKPIYNDSGVILMKKGATLKEKYKEKIKKMGYNNIYVTDELLQNEELDEIVSEEIKRESADQVKNALVNIESQAAFDSQVDELKRVTSNIIDDIINNKDLVLNISDMKMYSEYLFQHSVNVAILSIVLGNALELDQIKLYKLGLGALLHDVGKVYVSNNILDKEGELTEEEFKEVERHCEHGFNILKQYESIPSTSLNIAYSHHEKLDGSGYPGGKSGEDIHLFSKIVGVTDAFDALTSDRPFREAYSPSESMEYILGCAGTYFDRDIVKLFFDNVAAYPQGCNIFLSNNCEGIVVKNYKKFTLRPVIRIIKENGEDVEPYDIDLREGEYSSITIIGIKEKVS